MHRILVYGDSLSWGIIPNTRRRQPFGQRWPGVLERELARSGHAARVLEDCLNGRRTVWDDPFKPGRNGLVGLEQTLEIHSPLSLVIVLLGTNDFQSTHANNAALSAQGIAALVRAVRRAPIEPGMPVPPVLIVAPPAIRVAPAPMEKFAGAEVRCRGLADAYRQVAEELGCSFFDSGTVVVSSPTDGIHLDGDEHEVLGVELSKRVARLLESIEVPNAHLVP